MKPAAKISLIIGLYVVAAACFIVFVVRPALGGVLEASRQFMSEGSHNATAIKEFTELESFKKNRKAYDANLQKVHTIFVDGQNPVEFVQFLEIVAAQSGVVSEVSLAPQSPKGTVAFVVNTAGNFAGTAAFARKMETGPYLVSVKKISITKPEFVKDDPHYVAGQVKALFSLEVIAK